MPKYYTDISLSSQVGNGFRCRKNWPGEGRGGTELRSLSAPLPRVFVGSSTMKSDVDGSRSECSSTNGLPQVSATGNIHIGAMQGKLNGVMPATTSKDRRKEWLATLVPTFS